MEIWLKILCIIRKPFTGKWMTVCDGQFENLETAAYVACRQMGYQNGKVYHYTDKWGTENVTFTITTASRSNLIPYLVSANCTGNESYLVNYIDLYQGDEGFVESYSALKKPPFEATVRPNSCDIGNNATRGSVFPHVGRNALTKISKRMVKFSIMQCYYDFSEKIAMRKRSTYCWVIVLGRVAKCSTTITNSWNRI